jgi:hypothetical protein
MSTNTDSLSPRRPTRRAAWIISAAVLAAVAVLVTALVLLNTGSDRARPTKPVGGQDPPPPTHSVVYDCRPTRVIHPC